MLKEKGYMAKNSEIVRSSLLVFNFATSQDAWEGMNEYFYHNTGKEGLVMSGGASYGYDIMMKVEEPVVDPSFNFARMFNYHEMKWIMLQKNYLDITELNKLKDDLAKRSFKASSHFTHTLRFHNKKENGKECLISLTISKRQGILRPTLVLHTRAIEITKRFLLDLLLVQRIAEYILDKRKYSLTIYCPVVYQDADTFTMYHSHRSITKLGLAIPKGTKWQARVNKALVTFMETPIDKINYKVNRRCAKQLQIDKDGLPLGSKNRKLLAKDLQLKTDETEKRKRRSNPVDTIQA